MSKQFHKPARLDTPDIKIDIYKRRINKPGPFGGDYNYYHLNSIQALPENPLGEDKRFQKGNWLISLAYMRLVLILDKDTKEIVWSFGRAFGVTKEGEIVWEWFNPEFNEEGKRGTIYRMIRYPKDKIEKILREG